MYFQNILVCSVALLAGTSTAANYLGGEVPSQLRKDRPAMNRPIFDVASSSAAKMVTVASSAAASSKVALPTSAAVREQVASSAAPSSSFKSSMRPSKASKSMATASSSVRHHPAQATSAGSSSSKKLSNPGDVRLPVQEVTDQAMSKSEKDDDKDRNKVYKPFWIKTYSFNSGKARPNTPGFSVAPEMRVDDKDSCSLRCQDLANQCAELLPNDNDFW